MKPLTLYKLEGSQVLKQPNVYPSEKEAWLADGWSLVNPEIVKPSALNINIATQDDLVKAGLTIAQSKELIKTRPFDNLEDAVSKSKSVSVLLEMGISLVV